MSSSLVLLILGLVVIVGVLALLWKALAGRTSGRASFSIAGLLEAKVELGAEQKSAATAAVAKAASARGQVDTDTAKRALAHITTTSLRRLLWVDDHPDNNTNEVVALELLGFLVTSATSTLAGLSYLQQLDFAVAITDLGRGNDPKAGLGFIAAAHQVKPHLPIVIYTSNAASHRAEGVDAGATAVYDHPSDLIVEVFRAT